MKIFLFLVLSFNILIANRIEINLNPIKSEYYSINNEIGMVTYNTFIDKNLFVISNDISKLRNNIYTTNQEKAFWLLTDGFIEVLKRYKFTNKQYIYFSFYDDKKKTFYQNMYLEIKISDLKQFNNRDFNNNDKLILSNDSLDKYKILPIRDLFKLSKITIRKNGNLIVSNKLTKKYHNFVNEYTFNSIGRFEFDIENNKDKIIDLEKFIHSYCLSGDYNKVKLYVELGFDINQKDNENYQTLLEYASTKGHYNIVKLLVDNGANPNIHKKDFENAYLSAKRKGFTKIAKLLKPITTMTVHPKTSNLTNYSTSDLKNLCLSGSRRYQSCIHIQDKDLRNICLGLTTYPSKCNSINDDDLRNFCLGASKQSPLSCNSIKNNDLRNSCLGISKNNLHCNRIKNNNLKNMCIGISRNSSNCYNIK